MRRAGRLRFRPRGRLGARERDDLQGLRECDVREDPPLVPGARARAPTAPSVKATGVRESESIAERYVRTLRERRSPWLLVASWERPSLSWACCYSLAAESAASLRPSRRLRSRSSPPPPGSTSNTTWVPTGPGRAAL